MPDVYLDEFNRVARQAFCMWNREPSSPSFGSFDRLYWGWKYRDFSDATKQYAVRLALDYARLNGVTAGLPRLLEGFVDYCRRIQHRDGSFDQCYPYEKTPGVVYDLLSTLVDVRRCPLLESEQRRRELEGVVARAAAFAMRVDERHGAVANHIAQFAYELLYYADYANDAQARARAEGYLERLLSLWDREEGWFREYSGPDPGYQTRTLRYLVKCCRLLERPELWEVACKAADFVGALIMPDGSIHPMLGTRSTALVYPSGFEVLAARLPRYAGLAARVREGWSRGRVPLPSTLDFDNAMRLADDARDAAEVARDATAAEEPEPEPADVAFPRAGLTIARRDCYVAYLGQRLGGVVVVYGRSRDRGWRLLCEDSGYLARDGQGGDCWVSRAPEAGDLLESTPDRWRVRARFRRALHEELRPTRFIALRLLNLTLLRVQWLGDLFRKMVVRHLMGASDLGPLELTRQVELRAREVVITDRVAAVGGRSLRSLALFRCRRLVGIHMASSRYFQPQELEATPLDWMQPLEWDPSNESRHTVRVDVAAGTVGA